MFGIGTPELIVLLVVALIVFGPQRLPEIAQQIGKAIRDFRQMSADVTGEFNRAISLEEPPPVPDAPPVTAPVADAALAAGATDAERANGQQPDTTFDAVPWTSAGDGAAESSAAAAGETLVATRDDPRTAVSLLDEDGTVRAVPARGESEAVVFRPADDDVIDLSAEPVPSSEAAAVLTAPVVATAAEPADPVAAAWEAVITTDATAPAATADQPNGAQSDAVAATAPPQWTMTAPDRPVVDPAAEPTIREVIEAQIAAEAMRERRRVATYKRTRKQS
jgi:Tat protein translocase TatB subunit